MGLALGITTSIVLAIVIALIGSAIPSVRMAGDYLYLYGLITWGCFCFFLFA